MKKIEKSKENLLKDISLLKHEIEKLQAAENAYNLLKLSEQKYRAMADNSNESILIGIDQFYITDCNDSASLMFGYQKEELIGLKVTNLLSPVCSDAFLSNNGKAYSFDSEGLRKDGSYFPIEISFKFIDGLKGNNNIKWILYVRNNSLYKDSEKRFIETEKKLKSINYTKDKFISIISHDLKSPLNALLGMGEILMNHYDKIDEDELKIFIQNIYISTQQAAKLVDNLLEWSRIQMGSIQSEPSKTDLADIINSTVQLLEVSATVKEITIIKDFKKPLAVYADENMVKTVIRNLLSNAIKFTNFGGRVTIQVFEKDTFLEVSVNDNGTGIKKDQLEKLFQNEINYSTPGTNREKGTGLGLVLSREFVKLNGGTIYAESEPGKGSTFKFTLPKPGLNDSNNNTTSSLISF